MAFLQTKNRANSTLASGINDSVTELTVATGEGTRFPASNFHITVCVTGPPETNIEIMLCSSRTGDVLTVVRAKESTAAVAHTSGEKVELRVTAGIIDELQTEKISRDGTIPFIGEQAMGNNKITGLATPTAAGDATTKGYVDGVVWEKVYDHTLTENGLFDVTGLDLDTDVVYMIIMNLKLLGVGDDISLNVNEDYEATHYYTQRLNVSHETVAATRANDAIIAASAGLECFISGIMVREPGGSPRFKGSANTKTAAGIEMDDFAWVFNVNANVTSLRVSYGAARIVPDSRLMIFKIPT